ncbi:MAG: ABC transporter transmembrane domain-containing protein [Candidatus Dasytiphilus stammeri]
MISLLKPILDEGIIKTNHLILLSIPVTLIGMMRLRGVSCYVSSYCMSWVSSKVVMNMRRLLFNHLMGMPVVF